VQDHNKNKSLNSSKYVLSPKNNSDRKPLAAYLPEDGQQSSKGVKVISVDPEIV